MLTKGKTSMKTVLSLGSTRNFAATVLWNHEKLHGDIFKVAGPG